MNIYPNAAFGREILIQKSAQKEELKNAFNRFMNNHRDFHMKLMHVGEGAFEYNPLTHKIVAANFDALNKLDHKIICQDFYRFHISELATSIAAAGLDKPKKSHSNAIYHFFQQTLLKASKKEKSEDITEHGYFEAVKLLEIKMNKLLDGKLKTQAEKETLEYKAAKEKKRIEKQIYILEDEIAEKENDVKKLLPIYLKDEVIEDYHQRKCFELIGEALDALEKKLAGNPRDEIAHLTKAVLKCFTDLKNAFEKSENLEQADEKPEEVFLRSARVLDFAILDDKGFNQFFSEEIINKCSAIKKYLPFLLEKCNRRHVLEREIEEKKREVDLLKNPPIELPPVMPPEEKKIPEESPHDIINPPQPESKKEPVIQPQPIVNPIKEQPIEQPAILPPKVEVNPISSKLIINPIPLDVKPKEQEKEPVTKIENEIKPDPKLPIQDDLIIEDKPNTPPENKPLNEDKPNQPIKEISGFKKFLNTLSKPFLWFGNLMKRLIKFFFSSEE